MANRSIGVRDGLRLVQSARGRRDRRRDTSVDEFVVGLLAPINGSAGIWGPSAIACAQLAQVEINASGGLLERAVRLHVIDASDEALAVGSLTADLMQAGAIDAIVGMHTSQVRERVLHDLNLQVPYIYTPLYEGGETTPGVFAIGETPQTQLRPALEHLARRFGARRWMLIGNDYVWPRVSHRYAAQYVRELPGEVLSTHYLPVGTTDFGPVLETIRRKRPDAVLLSLIGQDAVLFNREFGASDLSRGVLRLSAAIEENGLLAIGAENTEGLFVSSGYFAALDTEANMSFRERYYNHFGQRVPALNALGQSAYEGVHFMASIVVRAAESEAPFVGDLHEPLLFRSVRGTQFLGNQRCSSPMYIAEAGGHFFRKPVVL